MVYVSNSYLLFFYNKNIVPKGKGKGIMKPENKKSKFFHFFDVMMVQTLITALLLLAVLVTFTAKPVVDTIFSGEDNSHSLEALAEKIITLFDKDKSVPAMSPQNGVEYPDIEKILDDVYTQKGN